MNGMSDNVLADILISLGGVAASFVGKKTGDLISWLTKLVGSGIHALEQHGVIITQADLNSWKDDAAARAKALDS